MSERKKGLGECDWTQHKPATLLDRQVYNSTRNNFSIRNKVRSSIINNIMKRNLFLWSPVVAERVSAC
jgi:hypothetical protein